MPYDILYLDTEKQGYTMSFNEFSKILELKNLIKEIRKIKLYLAELEIESIENNNNSNTSKINNLQCQLEKLTTKKNKLNEDLIEDDEAFESSRMKYALMFLMNFGTVSKDIA